MDDETTIKIPLPEGTRPDPDTVDTQKIPRVTKTTLEMPTLLPRRDTFVVPTLPRHLLGDPILFMGAPKPDHTMLFDQLGGPRKPRNKTGKRRRMQTADKVLLSMGVTTAMSIAFVSCMVAYGWGAGPMPEEEIFPRSSRTFRVITPSAEPSTPATVRQAPVPKRTRAAVVVAAPTTYSPRPARSIVVVPSPTRTSQAPSARETPSQSPEPTETPTTPSGTPSASVTPSQSPTSPSPSSSVEPQ
jgi:hypothetical protein